MEYEDIVKRYKNIILLREQGKTLQEIGNLYGCTRQAIEIRIKKGFPKKSPVVETHGLSKKFSGRDVVREQVRIRDNHTCQDCKKIWREGNRRFDVHHLNGLCGKKSRGYDTVQDMEGLVTLCHKCHYNRPEHRMKVKTRERLERLTKS